MMFGDAALLTLAIVAGFYGGSTYARTFYRRLQRLSVAAGTSSFSDLGSSTFSTLIRYAAFVAVFLLVHSCAGTPGAMAFTVAGMTSFWLQLLALRRSTS